MINYFPKDEPPEVEEAQLEEVPMRCPKCQSEEVIFNGLVTQLPDDEFPSADAEPPLSSSAADASKKFDWTCDSCGYEWKDDGVAQNQ